MNPAMVQRILGFILIGFSTTMVPPILVSLSYEDGHTQPFLAGLLVALGLGLAAWLPVRHVHRELRLRDGFLLVVLLWVVVVLVGAVPFLVSDLPHLTYTEAIFESVSGFTTSSASVVSGLDHLPKSMLWYRQQTQWVGGVGTIVLAVAVLPILGIGGMQISKADTPGPVKQEKLTPRVMQTARALWAVYVGLTAACAFGYWFAGMDGFDAIGHAFATVSTGGFSTHDHGLAHFDSFGIDMVAVVFMFFGGVNFAMHFLAWREKDLATYLTDPQFRAYLWITLSLVVFVTTYLYASHTYATLPLAFRYGALQVVSMQTTTGYTTAHFATWPGALPVLLLLITFVGGCAGSTAGGITVIRWQLVVKQGMRELKRLVHPNAELPVKFADKRVPGRILAAVTGFFAMYLLLFGFMMLVLMATGLDQVSAWSAIASCLNNGGAGLGQVATGFQTVPVAGQWVCIAAMLIGRLEVFTLLVLFTPAFWRH